MLLQLKPNEARQKVYVTSDNGTPTRPAAFLLLQLNFKSNTSKGNVVVIP
jgi:hypothetical protein